MPVTYYIMLPEDSNEELLYETNILGDESFGTFYANSGMNSLHEIVNNHPEMLKHTTITDQSGTKYTVTEFIDKLKQWKLRFN